MPTLPKIDPIDFLIKRKFPELAQAAPGSGLNKRRRRVLAQGGFLVPEPQKATPEAALTIEAIKAYRVEMAGLPSEELQRRYREEMAKKCDEDDQERFFNASNAVADFEYWSKMAHWTLDEAIALSFGKAPEIVRWQRLEKIPSYLSPFVREYSRTRELALRAVAWKKLFDPMLPTIFVAWTKANEIPAPEKLVQLVESRGGKLIDWKKRYDELLVRNNANVENAEELIEAQNKRIAELKSATNDPKPLHTKERETLLKLVIGMAVGGYGYDPSAARSPVPADITDDLAVRGVSLDIDTVRKWLREAADLLPGKLPDE